MASATDYLASLARSGVDTSQVNPIFAARMQNLISAAEAATGGTVQVTSGYRSPEHQAQIYANYTQKPVEYGGKTYTPNGRSGIAAGPGKSEHQLGTAIDISPTGAAYKWMVAHAPEYGVESGTTWRGSQYDPPHFQLPRSEVSAALKGQLPMPPPADIPSAPAGANLPSIYTDQYPSFGDNPSMSQPPVPLAPSQPFSIPAFTSPADQIGLGDSLAFNPVTGPAALSLGSYNSSYPVVGTGNPLDYGSVAAGAGSGLADLNAVPTAPPAPTLASLLPSILAPTIADDSTGFAAPAGASLPPLPRTDPRPAVAPATVSINGHPYVVGQTYQTADGASFQANANGTFTKTANTFRNPTMLQLAIQSQAPGAMANLNNAVSTVKGAASNALSGVGSLLGGLFGGNSAPPTPTAPALSGDGGWGAFMAPASIPPSASSDNGGWGAYFAPTAPSAPSLGSDNGGWGDYSDNLSNGADLSSLSANIPASSVPQYISVAHQVAVPGSDPAGDAQSGVHWDDAAGSFKLDSSPAPAAPSYKTVYEKELNPAYIAPPPYVAPPLAYSAGYGETDPDAFSTKFGNWFGTTPLGHIGSFLQGEAPVGGGGLLGMLTSGLSGPSKASGGLLGALTPQSSGGGLLGALMPSTNGYLYQPNGQGGYTNVGHAPSAPSYDQLAAKILSTNVDTGSYQSAGGSFGGFGNNQSLTG